MRQSDLTPYYTGYIRACLRLQADCRRAGDVEGERLAIIAEDEARQRLRAVRETERAA